MVGYVPDNSLAAFEYLTIVDVVDCAKVSMVYGAPVFFCQPATHTHQTLCCIPCLGVVNDYEHLGPRDSMFLTLNCYLWN